MGMQKRWSRRIVVKGVEYRYHVAEDQHDGLSLNICVQQIEPAGQRLLSGFEKPKMMVELESGHQWGCPISHAVTPRVIRELILAAIGRGWRPWESGLGVPFTRLADRIAASSSQRHAKG